MSRYARSMVSKETRGMVRPYPSNAMMTGYKHIALAQGRGNAGISPVAGIIVGLREQNLDVKVNVVPRARGEVPMHPSHLNYFPLPLIFYAIFAGALLALSILVQLKLLRYAYIRIGPDSRVALLVLLGSLLGSYINIPVARLAEARVASDEVIDFFSMRYVVPVEVDWPGTIIAVNVDGALIPSLLSIYLLARNRIWHLGAVGTVIVAVIVNRLAFPVPGVGIAVPVLAPPLVTAVVALLLSPRSAGPLAYVSGSLGTLIGADLLNLDKLHGLGAPVASIGGAGTFDGIFVTGILAVLLAGLGAQ
jgi:uncharacterized membrane protein